MASASRTIRVKLPRALLKELTAVAEAERRTVPALIVRAVAADLRSGSVRPVAAKRRR